MKIFIARMMFIILLSSCSTVKIHLPTDQLFFVGDAPLIQAELSEKRQKYRFKYLKNKGTRFEVLKDIERLSETGLDYLKTGRFNESEYVEFAGMARIGTQLIMWLGILESQNEVADISTFPEHTQIYETFTKHSSLRSIDFQSPSLDNEEDQILPIIILFRDALKAQLH